ncbi:MAG: RHS repeat domain-containing protein, partial [Planctomycetota bacterium]
FAYDALGRRIRKIDSIAGTTRLYFYNDKWQVLTETDASETMKAWYAYGNYIDEVLLTCHVNYALLTRYYVHDHLYSPAAMAAGNGTVLERYEYDAYGNPYVLEPNFAADPDGKTDWANPYYFTGRRADFLDGGKLTLQINRHRYYDYYTGRWLTHDPLGITPAAGPLNPFAIHKQYTDALNLYEYALDSPARYIDPLGLVKCDGGKWWVAGSSTSLSVVVPTIKRSYLKLVCKKAILRGYYHYKCCDALEFSTKVWKVPIALIKITDVALGVGAGLSHLLITGTISGADDSADVGGFALSGPGFGATAILWGVSFGGGTPGSGPSGGGGASISVTIAGGAWTTVLRAGHEIVEEDLGTGYADLMKYCHCRKKFALHSSTPWVSTPLEAKPDPHPLGFSTEEH